MAKKSEFIRGKVKDKSGLTFSLFHKITPFIIMFFSLVISTQKCARELNFDANIIGKPFMIIKGNPIYPPYAIFIAYLTSASKGNLVLGNIIYKCMRPLVVGVMASVIIYFFLVYIRSTMSEADKNLMATGRWATKKDYKDCGLFADCGIVIGQTYDAEIKVSQEKGLRLDVQKTGDLIQYNTNACGICFAQTRTGKGINSVITSHLNYPTSIFSFDPKAENYRITAGWRCKFSYVYKYAPTERDTLYYNILDDISEDFAYRDANIVADILTQPTNPASNADPHWQNSARTLITAAILHCKCSDYEDKSLPGVYKFLTCVDEIEKGSKNPRRDVLNKMIKGKHCSKSIHESIKAEASQIANAADEEMGSIFSSALVALNVFNDPTIASSCRTSDFTIDDYKYAKFPVSWYLCIPVADTNRLASLTRVLIQFVCTRFSKDLDGKPLKNRLMIIIDELPILGKLDCVETYAGILNGFNVSFLWICQTKAQIDKLYGQNAPILEHARFMWIFAINDHNVAEYFSKRAGTEGIIKQNSSSSGSKFDYGMNNVTLSSDITERPLITANEIENLSPDSLLLFTQGNPTGLAKKIAYYSDPRFKDKANLPKPETREEMLTQTVESRVLREGDIKWWEQFEDYEEDLSYYPENDLTATENSLEKNPQQEAAIA